MSGDGSSPERDDINRLNEKVTILSERLHHLYHEIRQVFNILDDIKSTPILSPTAGTDLLRLKIKYIIFYTFFKIGKAPQATSQEDDQPKPTQILTSSYIQIHDENRAQQ